jgi:light-regulated signal transduction histidine kinase (bacteriophytochrome)
MVRKTKGNAELFKEIERLRQRLAETEEIVETIGKGEHNANEKEPDKHDQTLEDLVKQRTAELEKANLALQSEMNERVQAEEALYQRTVELESANSELESFSYSVSHDLRAPLRILDGFSEAVLEEYGDQLGPNGQDFLIRIRRAAQMMSRLIDDLLKLSRVSRTEMLTNKVDLSRVAKSIVDELQAAQPERPAKFTIPPRIMVQADARLLEIAVRNLLENAWKFTRKCGEACIEIGLTEKNGETVYFVKDNGVGFNMKNADMLFQPFRRFHSEQDYPGTGIGLATVRRIIRRHGGDIWAESAVDKGATFYFTLGEPKISTSVK